jgi:hypothetical protein
MPAQPSPLRGLHFFTTSSRYNVQTTNFSQLSRQSQFMIRLCQRVNYGSILNLRVTDGDVNLDALQEVSIDVRLDGDFVERPELQLADFELPVETCRLLVRIDALKNGVIEKIVVHAGIPRRVFLRGPLPEVRK